jgi:hypothetical protein
MFGLQNGYPFSRIPAARMVENRVRVDADAVDRNLRPAHGAEFEINGRLVVVVRDAATRRLRFVCLL